MTAENEVLYSGDIYGFQVTFEGTGKITDESGESIGTLTTLRRRSLTHCLLYYPQNPFSVIFAPDCSVRCTDGAEVLTVTQQRRFPLPRFVLARGGECVGTITQRSLLLNTYSLRFTRGETWAFHMPLFTTFFHGVSNVGRRVAAREWSKRVWYVRGESGSLDTDLLFALAVVHRERLRFS